MRPKKGRIPAGRVARKLVALSVATAGRDLELAKKQAHHARKLMLRFNVRLDWPLRRFYCHGCKQLIVPGVNARVRLRGRGQKFVIITCENCGYLNRKLLKTKTGLNR